MEGILLLLLAAFAGCVLLMLGVVVMFVIEQVEDLLGRRCSSRKGKFEDE